MAAKMECRRREVKEEGEKVEMELGFRNRVVINLVLGLFALYYSAKIKSRHR